MAEVAAQLRWDGRRAVYIDPDLPSTLFLDDCHLTPAGNAWLAKTLVAAIDPFIRAWQRSGRGLLSAVRR
ncbi:MAG: hypothetical protein E6J45_12495 [Chloroflexi bacterium]|nr:MAG: hypothetical protein E6J45_12495 [Chloroflexota bacterium]